MLPDLEVLQALVARVMRVEDVTPGRDSRLVARFRGQLVLDSAEAYDRLSESLRPYGLTPLLRHEDSRHAFYLVTGLSRPDVSNRAVTLILFVLTLFSVLWIGAQYGYTGELPASFLDALRILLPRLWTGWPFAVSLLAILGAHEFGHYLVGRARKANVTLPYFIPMPFSLLGTMGAFIQMKEPPRDRRALLDIAIAGPLSGLVVAIPVLLIGLSLSSLGPIQAGPGTLLEGNSLLYLAAKYAVFGQLLPAPVSYGGLPPLLYWIVYFFTGWPFPEGGLDVQLHPVAWAGWAGLLVTAMNLIPVGQLDGGHVLYVLLGEKRMRIAYPIVLGLLGMLGLIWNGWWLWAGLMLIFGRSHAEPLDTVTELDPRRKRLALLMLFVFLLVFIPVPLVQIL